MMTADTIDDATLARDLFDEGRRAWPGLDVRFEAFAAHLARGAGDVLPSAELGPDLYLACACATGVRGAVAAFDRAYLADLRAPLRRFRTSPSFVDEVRQEVRDKLFVARGGAAPKIAEYRGKGTLASWVRVVAVRAALDLRRRSVAAGDEGEVDAPASGTPETAYEEERYRRAFDGALRGAVAVLDGDQRHLLRRHFADGITLEALAAELGVHRATVARHLATARTTLRLEARRRLQAALGARDSELESFAWRMRSRLDLSLSGLLQTG
jgi:RNA polymerase sigma-70 factor (ECF subfamily)